MYYLEKILEGIWSMAIVTLVILYAIGFAFLAVPAVVLGNFFVWMTRAIKEHAYESVRRR